MATPTFKKQPANRLPEPLPRSYRRRLLQHTRQNWVSVWISSLLFTCFLFFCAPKLTRGGRRAPWAA